LADKPCGAKYVHALHILRTGCKRSALPLRIIYKIKKNEAVIALQEFKLIVYASI